MQGSKINSMLTIEYMCNEKENQFFDRKTAQRILRKLENKELIEWVGTSNKDPKKIYRMK